MPTKRRAGMKEEKNVYWQPFCYLVRLELPIIEHKIHVYTRVIFSFSCYVSVMEWIYRIHTKLCLFLIQPFLPGYFILFVIDSMFFLFCYLGCWCFSVDYMWWLSIILNNSWSSFLFFILLFFFFGWQTILRFIVTLPLELLTIVMSIYLFIYLFLVFFRKKSFVWQFFLLLLFNKMFGAHMCLNNNNNNERFLRSGVEGDEAALWCVI